MGKSRSNLSKSFECLNHPNHYACDSPIFRQFEENCGLRITGPRFLYTANGNIAYILAYLVSNKMEPSD